jgi:autotransporter-associated beta strand protein
MFRILRLSRQVSILAAGLFLLVHIPSARAFDHPSALHTQADFDRMKAKVQAGAHPWIDSWNILINNSSANLGYPTHPQAVLQRGNGGGACLSADNYQFAYYDTAAAYQFALRWKGTGDNRYADAAINILNQWSSTCTNLCGDPNIQLLEIYGYQFAVAGDIMRSYTNWAAADVQRFQVWMVNLWYPMDHGFLLQHMGACATHQWANWDLCSMNSMMAIGILCDDTNIYNEALTYFKNGLGAGNIEQTVYYMFPGYLGQGQEEGRDQGHSGMDVAMLGVFCTMAYNHGDDLFAYQNNRVLSLCEYFAEYNLGYGVPYTTYGNCDATPQTSIGGSSQGDNRPAWDLIYNHYVNLKGLAAPWSTIYATRSRPEGGGGNYGGNSGGYDQLGFTTLTCSLDPIVVGANPSGLTANLSGPQQVILNWWGTANATNYLVKRATTSGGPYTTIATNTANLVTYTDLGANETITTNLLTYTDSSVTNGVTYYYTVSALTPLGESGNALEQRVSLLPQLIAYYKFDESSGKKAADASGNGQAATLTGATFLAVGHSNNSVNMNGSMQFVTLPAGITTNLTDFTIATWVYLNGTQGYWSRLFDFGAGVTNSAGWPMRYMFLCPSAGSINFTISVGSDQVENGYSPAQSVTTASVLPINSWHHVAVTLAGTTCSIYVDGVLAGSGTITITPSQLGTTTQNCIGRSQWTSDPYLIGRVDDFRIYNGALSAAQLAALVAAYPVPPPAPTNVVATVVSANEIDFTWSPANGATNYYVKRSTTSGGPYTTISAPLTQTNFSDTSLIGGNTYYYVVTAINDGGATNSTPVSATTLTAPAAPASLTATAVSSSQINLSWPASAGATSYNVNSANFSGGPYTVIATNVTATGYTNTGLHNGATYYYVVTAVNANGVSTNSLEASATTQPLPAMPAGVMATPGNLSVQVQWNAAAYAASYNVKRSTTSASGYFTIASNVMTAGFLDTGLTNGTTYYYVVSAVNAVGESANSAEVSATPTDLLDWWKFDETSGSTAADSGARANNGTLMGGATWISGISSNAVHLDGTANGYVSFPSGLVSTLNDFSICSWVKADASATWARVFDFGSGTGTYMFLSPFNGSGTVRYAILTPSSGGEQGINSPAALSTGTWHHLAVTLSGTTGVLYIDGQAVGTNSSMTLTPSSLGSTTTNYIGKSQWNDPNLTGSVDDFRIYARALSGGEIAALSTFVPPAPTGLAAVAGNANATLVWGASSGATSYNVKRATTSGSNYVTVASAATSHYVDSGLVNGTTYYYVVSAVSAAGESANSAEASVVPNAGAATALIWSGAVNGTWDTTTANWLNSVSSATFADGNTAIFADAGTNTTISLSASRSPGTTIVNNATANYTLAGSAIAGTGSLVKSGSGTLTLSNANTFSGGTTLNAGQITLGASASGSGNSVTSGPLGQSTLTLGGGKLQMNKQTLGNNLLAAANTTTVIDNAGGDGYLDGNLSGSGTVTLQNSSSIGLSLKIAFNATVDWSGFTGTLNYNVANGNVFNVFLPTSFNLAQATLNTGGSGTPPGNWSSIRAGGTNRLGALSGAKGYLDIGGIWVVGSLNTSTTFGGAIIDTGGITKVGTGTLTLSGANTYTGPTTVSNGELVVSTVFAGNGIFLVTNSATLGVTNLSATSALISNLVTAAGSTLEFQNVSGTTTPLVLASNVTVSGGCTVKITGASGLVAGNSYPLISYAGTLNGMFANLQLQMPHGWRGALVNNGNQISLANVAVVSTTPPRMSATPNGQQLQLFWPQANTGWRLQAQTNALNAGLGTNWTDIPAAIATNQIGVPLVATNGCVFFRLVYP